MKLSQPKNYKKPLYAAGLAAAIMAASLTGCTDPDKLKTGGTAEISVDEENIKVVQDSITAGIVSIVFE
ncbi:MAG: hypothetical protein IJL19_04995 [Clostridiales bacterium]|nr:hypothetical protein [Clostridiales bacterium]